jgi:hypothetical protein
VPAPAPLTPAPELSPPTFVLNFLAVTSIAQKFVICAQVLVNRESEPTQRYGFCGTEMGPPSRDAAPFDHIVLPNVDPALPRANGSCRSLKKKSM